MKEQRFREKTDYRGRLTEFDIYPSFKDKILEVLDGVKVKPLKLVVDAGNGIGGKIFDYVFGDLPFEVTKMYFEPDGNFPNHVPDPLKEENVKEIKQKTVELNADIGIAIDGDADRVFFIDNKGRNPSGVFTGALFAKKFLELEPDAKIIQDPRLTWPIQKEVERIGGESIKSRAGHSYFKQKMKEYDAIYGAEMSSHFFYRDFYYTDSGMMTIVYMIKFLSEGVDFDQEMDHMYASYPNCGEVNFVVENIPIIIEKVQNVYSEGTLSTIDGIGIEFEDWRFNLRGSNTQPLLRLNLEAKTKELVISKYREIEALIGGKRDNLPALEELQ